MAKSGEVLRRLSCHAQGQEVVPNVFNPQARSDLESLIRLAVEQFGAALGKKTVRTRRLPSLYSRIECCAGVPSELIFQSRFSSNSTSQMSLLNSTITQLAKSVNQVLTMAYRDIYQDEDSEDDVYLELITAPLAATEEVMALYAAGLAPIEIAMPAVLHAIGASKEQISKSVESAVKAKEEEEKCACEERDFRKTDRDMGLQERKVALEGNGTKSKAEGEAATLDLEQRKANIEKTKRETSVLQKKPTAAASSK